MRHKENLAYEFKPDTQPQEAFFQARVAGMINDWYLFDHQISAGRAKKSASCLLTPEVGDEVLIFAGQTNNYIMSVLEQADKNQPAEIAFPAGAEFRCQKGALEFTADAVRIHGNETLNLDAQQLSLNATESRLRSNQFLAWIGQVDAKAIGVKLVAHQVSTVFGRLIARAKESFRWTEGLDETRSGRIRVVSSDRIQMSSKHTSIRAEGYVKIDGEKIDLG